EREEVHDRQKLALEEPEVDHGDDERDPLEPGALAEEAGERQRHEGGDTCQIGRLHADRLAPARRGVLVLEAPRAGRRPAGGCCLLRAVRLNGDASRMAPYGQRDQARGRPARHLAPSGVSSWRAIRRALLRTARDALVTLIVARETAS